MSRLEKLLIWGGVIFFLVGFFPLTQNSANLEGAQFHTMTFGDLGYTTSIFQHGQQLIFEINCTGSNISFYDVTIHLHGSGDRVVVRYRVNGGTELDFGDFTEHEPRWRKRTVNPGQFLNGSNELRFMIIAYNQDPDGYVTIFADSYLEIRNEYDTAIQTSQDSLTTGTEPLTTAISSRSSTTDGFFGGLLVGGLVTGVMGGAGILYYIRKRPSERRPHTLFFAPDGVSYDCMLCKDKHTEDIPRMTCESCYQSICIDGFADMVEVGRKTCPYCEGKLAID